MLVEHTLKGKLITDTIYIFTGSSGDDCGYKFEVGKNYILYALYYTSGRPAGINYIDNKLVLFTSRCTRNKLFQTEEKKVIEKYLKSKTQ